VGFDFFLRNQHTLQIPQHGFVRDANGRGVVIRLTLDGSGIYMKDGSSIAGKFGLNVPTLAKFEYLGPLNMFLVSFLPDEIAHVANNVEEVIEVAHNPQGVQQVLKVEDAAQEVIDISSDEEVLIASDQQEQDQHVQHQQDPHCFQQIVSAAMAHSITGQPMVSSTNLLVLISNELLLNWLVFGEYKL
jgi:hypothetical protein